MLKELGIEEKRRPGTQKELLIEEEQRGLTQGHQCQTCDVYFMDGFALNKELLPGSFSLLLSESLRRNYLVPPVYYSRDLIQRIYNDSIFVEKSPAEGFFTRNKQGDLVLVDQAVISSQKGIFSEVLGQAAKFLLTGRGLVRMSLPVRIFEPESAL